MNNNSIDSKESIDKSLIDKLESFKNTDEVIGINDIILLVYYYLKPNKEYENYIFGRVQMGIEDKEYHKKIENIDSNMQNLESFGYVIGEDFAKGEKIPINTGNGVTLSHLYTFIKDKITNDKLDRKLIDVWKRLDTEEIIYHTLDDPIDEAACDANGSLYPYILENTVAETLDAFLKQDGAIEKLKTESIPINLFKEFEMTSPYYIK